MADLESGEPVLQQHEVRWVAEFGRQLIWVRGLRDVVQDDVKVPLEMPDLPHEAFRVAMMKQAAVDEQRGDRPVFRCGCLDTHQHLGLTFTASKFDRIQSWTSCIRGLWHRLCMRAAASEKLFMMKSHRESHIFMNILVTGKEEDAIFSGGDGM
ncbi:MAG: hypothetical protein U1F81_11835 [Verrucomicrobiaceae bacterium]